MINYLYLVVEVLSISQVRSKRESWPLNALSCWRKGIASPHAALVVKQCLGGHCLRLREAMAQRTCAYLTSFNLLLREYLVSVAGASIGL